MSHHRPNAAHTRPPHRLFFAVQPDAAASAQALARIAALQARQRLGGRPIAAGRRHVTLHWLADHDVLPADLLAAARGAGAAVEHAPFDVVFDQLGSIGDAGHPGPLVLGGGEGLRDLRGLQRALGHELEAAGLGRYVQQRFQPHMTLLYPRPMVYVPTHAVTPLCWTLRELLLIDSQAQPAAYVVLGRWPLHSRERSDD